MQSLNTSFVSDTAGAGEMRVLTNLGLPNQTSSPAGVPGQVKPKKRKRTKPDKTQEPVRRSARKAGPVSDSSNVGKIM